MASFFVPRVRLRQSAPLCLVLSAEALPSWHVFCYPHQTSGFIHYKSGEEVHHGKYERAD
jgi:hypothetical protein